MSDLSDEDDSMGEDDSGDESGSSEDEEEVSGDESGSDYESVDEEENAEEQSNSVAENEQQAMSSSSDEGGQRERCPVCLNRFIGQDLGTPENCEHIFCFECIKEWSSNINTCPIDRNEFNYIHVKRSPDGKILKKVKVKVLSKGPEEGTIPEDNTLCEVCRQGDREHRLLLCDSCDLAYHCDCLDPPLFHIPIEEWFCPPCSEVMTQMGNRAALPSTSRSRRVIPRTSASESVRARVQNRRTSSSISRPSTSRPSTSRASTSRTSSTSRPKKRRRRAYRRVIKKVVNLARTKASGGAGKGGKGERTSAVIVTYGKRYRRRKRRRTKTKTRLSSKSAESKIKSAKERIAKRLGLVKAHNAGSTVPDVRSKPGPSSQGPSKERNHSLFGVRDQLMDFSENFNENLAGPSTSTPRNPPESAQPSTSSFNILDSILAGQTLLHTKSDNVIIKTDGSLIRKENEKKKSAKDTGSGSKSVVWVGLYKTNASSKSETPGKSKDFSLLRGALNKMKSPESRPRTQEDPGPSSSTSPVFISVNSRKSAKEEKPASKKDSSRPPKKSSDSKAKPREKDVSNSSGRPLSAFKNSSIIDKSVKKEDRTKYSASTSGSNNSKSRVSDAFSSPKPGTSNFANRIKSERIESTETSNFANRIKSERIESTEPPNVQDNASDHRLDILKKRASFLEKFNTKPTVSVKIENSPQNGIELSSPPIEIKSTVPQVSEIKIKDEPLSSDEEKECSESLIAQSGYDNSFSRTFKAEFQESESLIGNLVASDCISETTDSSEAKLIKPKIEIVSSDEEEVSNSGKCFTFAPEIKIKEEPNESAFKKHCDISLASGRQSKELPYPQAADRFDDLPCTQAVDHFDDFSTQAIEPMGDLPSTQAEDCFDDLLFTQAIETFDNLPSTQAEETQDLPCTQAVEGLDDLPCTQALEPLNTKNKKKFPKSLPNTDKDSEPNSSCSPMFISVNSRKTSKDDKCASKKDKAQAVERFDDLPPTQAVDGFNDLPCTQAVEHLDEEREDLPCPEADECFDDLQSTQVDDDLLDIQPIEHFNDLPATQAIQCADDFPCAQAVDHMKAVNTNKSLDSQTDFFKMPGTSSCSPIFISVNSRKTTKDDKPSQKKDGTQAVNHFGELPPTQAAEQFDDLPATQAVECFDDLPATQAADPMKAVNKNKSSDSQTDIFKVPGTSSCSPIFMSVNSRKTTKDKPSPKKDRTEAVNHFDDLPATQAVEHFDDLPATQAVECFDDLPATQAVEHFDDLPATQAADPLKAVNKNKSSDSQNDIFKVPRTSSCSPIFMSVNSRKTTKDKPSPKKDNTEAVNHFDDLPATQAVDDLPVTQAVEHFDDLPATQAVEHLNDLPATQAVNPMKAVNKNKSLDSQTDIFKVPATSSCSPIFMSVNSQKTTKDKPSQKKECTKAFNNFDDLPPTQAAERFDDLPATQAVDRFYDLPSTQAVEQFDDLPATQALEQFDDLPCTQGLESFDNLPCTQAMEQSSNLPPTQTVETIGNSFKLQASEPLTDLPSTQLANETLKDQLSKCHTNNKNSDKSVLIASSKMPKDSDLLDTQPNSPEIPSESEGCISTLQEEVKVKNELSLEEKILKAKQEALLQRKKVPPKVVGVHRNLPQVISSAPIRRPIIPKPINRRTFSFDQVKQHYNLEDSTNNAVIDTKTESKTCIKLENEIKTESHLSSDWSPIILSDSVHSVSDEKSGDFKDQKPVSNLRENLTPSKSANSTLSKETLQDVSNIKVNMLNKPMYRHPKEESQCYASPSTAQSSSFKNCYIKKEPLDIGETTQTNNVETTIQSPCKVKEEVDLHVGESNLERALRLKREMNAEVLQQNPFKNVVRNTNTIPRMLTIKQEENLEVMRENLLNVSVESRRHVKETFDCTIIAEKKPSARKAKTMQIKVEKDDPDFSYCHQNDSGVSKISQSECESRHIKKEPVEEQGKCSEIRLDSFKKSDHNKKSKSELGRKENKDKPVKDKVSSEKRNKSTANDKVKEKKKEDVHNIKSCNKNIEKDSVNRESKKNNKDHKEQNKKHVIKDEPNKERDPDRKIKCSAKEDKTKISDIRSIHKVKQENKESIQDNNKAFLSKNKGAENGKCNMEKSSSSKSSHNEKNNKEIDCDRKNKQSKSHENKEKSSDDMKYAEKVKNEDKNKNLYDKDKNSNKINDYDKKHNHSGSKKDGCKERKEKDFDRRNKYGEKNVVSKDSNSERNSKDKSDVRDKDSDHKSRNSERERHDSDRSHKHAEKSSKESSSNRNPKDPKDSADKYSDSKVRHEGKDKRCKESDSDKKIRHGDKGGNHDRSNKHSEKDGHSSGKRTSEGDTHKSKSRRESAHSEIDDRRKDSHSHRENSKHERLTNKDISNEERKRRHESESTNNSNKRRKISVEVGQQNLDGPSKCTSPDSTSGPDPTILGNIKPLTPLDERIQKMMSRGDLIAPTSSKKRRHESMSSESTSDVSRLSTEVHIKSENSPCYSPKQIRVEGTKHSAPSHGHKGPSTGGKKALDLKEEIANEIKMILKPFYTVGVVNKDDYKDIMRKAVPKIFLNCGNILNPEKIKKLVLGYVTKLKSS